MSKKRQILRKKKKRELRKRRQATRQKEYMQNIRSSCGECKACCYQFAVEEYGKEARQWCQHSCDQGCAIYKQSRAPVCEEYVCLWRYENKRKPGMLPRKYRPDKCGIILTHGGGPVIQVAEFRRGATNYRPAIDLINACVEGGDILYHCSGRIWYSKAHYQGMSEQEIIEIINRCTTQNVDSREQQINAHQPVDA